ncbi:hypothetical protein [Candidatus Solincola tengchongensis]|uniref:hypothetical protein n=1 Tax=Candidatus Solincola tengchongensis TaxID=2900693 RepID=UPI00257BE25D|nr:hypothetical protein [Candidatus Solincola tengchongensis]
MSSYEEGKRVGVETLRNGLANMLKVIGERDPQELARELLDGDGRLSEVLLESLPVLSQTLLEAARTILERMENLPPERAARILARALPGADGSLLGELINSFSRLLIRLHEERPELLVEEQVDFFSRATQAVDFGKLRKVLNYRAADRLEGLRREIEVLGDNPVALVNLFSVVAPAANQALQVLKTLFKVLDLPAEAMTYALFNILEEVDWKEAAEVINGAAAFLVNLHRGAYILGDGSLYATGPFSRIASDLVEGIDGPLLAEALAALGEEGEAMVSSLVEQALRDADLASSLLEAAASLANSSLRALAGIMESYSAIPIEVRSRMREAFARNLDAEELTRLSRSLASLLRGARLAGETGRPAAAEERPAIAWREIMEPLRAETLGRLGPLEVAKRFNDLLRVVNRRLREIPAGEGYAAALLDSLDRSELENLFRQSGSRLREALAARPETARAMVKGIITIIYQGFRGYLSSLRAGRRGRRR